MGNIDAALYQRVMNAQRRAQGRCKCARKLRGRHRGCSFCRLRERRAMRRLYWARRRLGLCTKCGWPAEGSRARCADCRGDTRRIYHERKAA